MVSVVELKRSLLCRMCSKQPEGCGSGHSSSAKLDTPSKFSSGSEHESEPRDGAQHCVSSGVPGSSVGRV